MSYSASFVPNNFVSRTTDTLKAIIPDLVISVVVSVVASVALTALTYSVSAAFGIPVVPFFFIMF